MGEDGGNRDPETYAIIGSAMEVHRALGNGFLEAVYQEALAIELDARGIPFRREVELPVYYKNHRLSCSYRADFVCFDSVIVELKALSELTPTHHAQVLNYLKATGFTRALLLNFGSPRLDTKRFILSQSSSPYLRPSASSADPSANSADKTEPESP